MTMPAVADRLVELDELAIYLRVPVDELDELADGLALELATGLVQNITRQRLVAVEDDEVTLPVRADGTVLLPQLPVTDVSAVALVNSLDPLVVGDPLPPASYLLAGGVLAGVDYRLGYPGTYVRVSYSHGFAVGAVPADLRGLVLGLAARNRSGDPGGVRQESLGGYAVTYATPAGELTDVERDVALRYRRRTL